MRSLGIQSMRHFASLSDWNILTGSTVGLWNTSLVSPHPFYLFLRLFRTPISLFSLPNTVAILIAIQRPAVSSFAVRLFKY